MMITDGDSAAGRLHCLVNRLRSLVSAEGGQLMAVLEEASVPPSATLIAKLRSRWDEELVAAALQQAALRRRAAEKYSKADKMFFTQEGLEQASSEVVARHRAEQFAARSRGVILDLCCGIGGDLAFLAEHGEVAGVDYDVSRIACARLNAEVYGVQDRVRLAVADVQKIRIDDGHSVFIDPSRREAGHRRGPDWYQPSLGWCYQLAERAALVAVKAAPGIERDLVPEGWGIEFVAVGRALKEAVLWSPSSGAAGRKASVLPGDAHLLAVPGDLVDVRPPGAYLLDPSPAVTRAELVEDLARTLDVWKIDSRIAFLSGDSPTPTPFGRWLRITDSLPWNVKNLRKALRARGIGRVDIRRRGLAGDVEQIGGSLGLRGGEKATLVMTRVEDRPWAFICADV
ncbi:class I SAM-dependent methyltransferase [Nonomuraea sp. NPDC048901]|uniref:class I SAM-dependent methyltransferase n=1 Tax=Nonomuraea sp. NPDC048901 TaxID=3155627 RepID=UPI00340CEB72